jgi:tetratricopeptide (TPR) repeat protein
MADLYTTEVKRFQDLLKENQAYAFERYGWTMFYSIPPERIHEMKAQFGWKPVTPLDHYNAGSILCRVGKIAQGLKHLEQAHEMGLDIPELCYNLALAYEKREDKRRAKAYFRKFIDVVEKQNYIKPSLRQSLDEVRAHLQEL